MTKSEAQNILAVHEGESAEKVKQKYGEMQNDYQMRLTNAPTPNLKRLYQKNILELNSAFELLCPNIDHLVASELPSSEPNFDTKFESPKVTRENFDNPPKTKKRAKKKEEGKGNVWASIAVGLIILLLSISILGFIEYNNQTEIAKDQADAIDKQALNLEKFNKNFINGKFKIKNNGKKPFTISWLIISYTDENNEIQKYAKSVNQIIKSGGTKEFSETKGGDVVWDGSVIFYVCKIKKSNGISYQSGIWSKDQKGGQLKWNWD